MRRWPWAASVAGVAGPGQRAHRMAELLISAVPSGVTGWRSLALVDELTGRWTIRFWLQKSRAPPPTLSRPERHSMLKSLWAYIGCGGLISL